MARVLSARREAMRVSWFAGGGELARGHSGRSEAEGEAGQHDAATTWTAPATDGPVFVWAVLRDDRGGATWATYRFEVAP